MVKVKIQYGNLDPTEYDLNPESSYDSHLVQACKLVRAPDNPTNYVFQLQSTETIISHEDFKNPAFELKAGSVLALRIKPYISCQKALVALKDERVAMRKKALFDLKTQLKENVFAQEFIKQGGIKEIQQALHTTTASTLSYALNAFEAALEQTRSYEIVSEDDMDKIISYVDSTNLSVCRGALELAVAITSNSKDGFDRTLKSFRKTSKQKEIPAFQNVISLLESSDLGVQKNSLMLINSILARAPDNLVDGLFKELDKLGLHALLRKQVSIEHADFMKQLHQYQCLLVNRIVSDKNASYDSNNKQHEKLLLDFWKLVFPDTELENRISHQWKDLGFQGTDPKTDFRGMGVLGLKQHYYFAQHYTDIYRKIVNEQMNRAENDYPVAVAGINISQTLVDLLTPQEVNPDDLEKLSQEIYKLSILLSHEYAFNEMYCIAFQVLNRMWDEMKASYMDFPNVLKVVRGQINDVLNNKPMNIENFQKMAFMLAHGVTKMKERQALRQRSTLQLSMVDQPLHMKWILTDIEKEVEQLVKKQKMQLMCDGCFFNIYKQKGKTIFYKLTPNFKEIKYGFATNITTAPLDTDLPQSVRVSELGSLVVGRNCTIFEKQKKVDDATVALCFQTIFKEGDKSLDFVAMSREDYAIWTDGLRTLMGLDLENDESFRDIDVLVDTELKVRMIELEDGTMTTPTLPVAPADFTFVSGDLKG